MTKLEYKLLEISPRDIEAALNKAGEDGWDISAVMEINPNLSRIILKRALASDIKMIGID